MVKIAHDKISEARRSGYMVMEYKVKELYPRHLKGQPDWDYESLFTVSDPDQWNDSGKPDVSKSGRLYLCRSFSSLRTIFELYLSKKEGIDSFTGGSLIDPDWTDPYCILYLANSVWSYLGEI